MRVHFKGLVLGAVALLVVVLVVLQHFRTQRQTLSLGGGKRNRQASSSERASPVTHRRRPAIGKAGRQGAASSAARIQAAGHPPGKKPPKTRKFGGGGGGGGGTSHRQGGSSRQAAEGPAGAAHADGPGRTPAEEPRQHAQSGAERSPDTRGAPDIPPPAPAAAVVPPPPEPASLQVSREDEKMNVPVVEDALGAEVRMDIRTVDPLSATEPMVIRQQEELTQQRFGFQPYRGRPNPPQKLLDLSKSWLTDMEYPQWYLDSVKRSRVYGKEKEWVGGDALFPGPCPGADETRAQMEAENIQTFSYIETGELIAASKNPCWYEDPRKRKQMRCLPYFYVAGVAKCGTTDFYKRLRYHPDIMEGELKEYHWWDRLRYGDPMELRFTKTRDKNDRPLPLAVYSRIIMGEEVEDMKMEMRKNRSEKICGDGSPSYLWDPKDWTHFEGNQGCTEPRIVIGSFIQHASPQSKIFLLFRQPTQRLYSRFLSRRDSYPPFRGSTSQTFHDYVVRGVALYKACFQEHSIRECAYSRTLYEEAEIRIIEGLYSVFMEDWLRIFKREQIMVIRNEDYSEDIEGHIIKAFRFLDVGPLDQRQMRPVLTHVTTNIGDNYKKVGPMLPETIAILNEFYKPFVLRLHELLGDDRFLWKDIAVT